MQPKNTVISLCQKLKKLQTKNFISTWQKCASFALSVDVDTGNHCRDVQRRRIFKQHHRERELVRSVYMNDLLPKVSISCREKLTKKCKFSCFSIM